MRTWLVTAAGCAISTAAFAHLTTIAPTSTDIADLVTKLDDPDLKIREDATRALRLHVDNFGPTAEGAMTHEEQLKLLLEQFRTRDLTLEQETRLSLIARDLFAMTDRAGMGVSFAIENDVGGVGIAGTVRQEGFYAHEVLKPGDVIRSADGIPVRSSSEMRAAVLSHDPGEIMSLTILRGGTIRKVDLKLGNFAQLDRPQLPENRTLDHAWKLRLNRELAAQGHRQPGAAKANGEQTIFSQIDEDRWANLERGLSIARSKMVQDARATGLVLEPRKAQPWEGPPQIIAAGGQPRRGKSYNLDGIDRGANAARFISIDRVAMLQRIDMANARINEQMQFIEIMSQQLNQAGVNAATRMALEAQIASAKASIARIEADIDLMKQLLENK